MVRSRVLLATSFAVVAGCAAGPLPLPTRPSEPAKLAAVEVAQRRSIEPDGAAVVVARQPAVGGACPLRWTPRDVGHVLILSKGIMARPMVPVIAALCACTLPGEYLTMVAQIDFFEGEVQVRAPESPAINACLSQLPIQFEPFRPDGPVSDCVGCGPRRYGVLHGSAPVDTPEPPGRIRMAYSFALDRSSEVLSCAPGTHAERGRCEPDVQAITVPVAATCGCDRANLRCAIDCAAGQER